MCIELCSKKYIYFFHFHNGLRYYPPMSKPSIIILHGDTEKTNERMASRGGYSSTEKQPALMQSQPHLGHWRGDSASRGRSKAARGAQLS